MSAKIPKEIDLKLQTEAGEFVTVSSHGSNGEVWLQISEPYNSLSATLTAGEAHKIEDALRKLREQGNKS